MSEEIKEEVVEGTVTPEGVAHYVTTEDLAENSELEGQGVAVGDLIYIPEVTTAE